MSNLPAKPEPGEISPRSPSQDDRHYTGRTVPMVSLSQYRREEPRRNDIYIARSPPRTRGPPIDSWDTYVARYDRREDDRCRREYTEWERHHGREYYRSRSRSAERRQRSTDRREHGGRNWEARHEYDRHDRGYRLNDRPPRSRNSADRDRRWRSRASVSPTRRTGLCLSHAYEVYMLIDSFTIHQVLATLRRSVAALQDRLDVDKPALVAHHPASHIRYHRHAD